MSDVGLVRRQVVAEQRSFWRNRAAAGFTILLPVMLLVVFATLLGGTHLSEAGGISFIAYYVPGILGFAVITACFTSLAMNVVNQREQGILKRKRSTPLPAWALIGGMVGSAITIALVLAVVTISIGTFLYGNHAPRHPLWVVGVVALGAMTFCALAIAVSAAIPNADAGPAVVNLLVLPLVFLSGTFFPVTNKTINRVSDLFPVRPFQQALFAAIDPRHLTTRPAGHDLLVLALWGVGGALVATRTFRWERRGP